MHAAVVGKLPALAVAHKTFQSVVLFWWVWVVVFWCFWCCFPLLVLVVVAAAVVFYCFCGGCGGTVLLVFERWCSGGRGVFQERPPRLYHKNLQECLPGASKTVREERCSRVSHKECLTRASCQMCLARVSYQKCLSVMPGVS